MDRFSPQAVPVYRYTPIAKLEESAVELSGLLKQTKKLKVEAKQKIFGSVENITIGDNSSFTINQNQTLLILQVEQLAEEILQTVKQLKKVFPSNIMSLPDAMKSYRTMVITDALATYNDNHAAAARALGMKKTTLDYSAPERRIK